jgi:hypothetical protein
VVRYCDQSLCGDRVVALRNRGLDALYVQVVMCALVVWCAQAYQMNEQALSIRAFLPASYTHAFQPAYRMSGLDVQCAQVVMCAQGYRKNVLGAQCALAYQMIALEQNLCGVVAHYALACAALGAHCAQRQTSLRESLALDDRPFQRRALMLIDVGCPLALPQSPLTLNRSASGNVQHVT